MPAANLDEIKTKYDFNKISIATWRNPALSVHPARGGPSSPNLSADGSYTPTYKINFDIASLSTDDEGSGDEEKNEEFEAEVPIDTTLDESIEEPTVQKSHSEDILEETSPASDKFDDIDEEPGDDSEDLSEKGQDLTLEKTESSMAAEESLPLLEKDIDAPEAETKTDSNDLLDLPPLEAPPPEDEAAVEAGHVSEAGSEERRVSFAPGTPDPKPTARKKKAAKGTKAKKKRIAVPIDSLPADVMAMIDGAFEGKGPPPPAPDPPVDVDDMLDDPKDPVATDEVADEVANEAADEGPVPPDEPAEQEVLLAPAAETAPPEDEVIVEIATDPPAEAVPEDLPEEKNEEALPELVPAPEATEEAPVDASATEQAPQPVLATEKSSKKKSSKSGKDKDRSKKKSSKSKSSELSPPPSGLGIEILPPPAPASDDNIDKNLEASTESPETEKAKDGEVSVEEDPKFTDENKDLPDVTDEGPKDPEVDSSPVDAFEAPDPEQADPGDAEEAGDKKTDASKAPPVADLENEDEIPAAWDQLDEVTELVDSATTAEHVQDGHTDAPEESASSPADSGVEFGVGGEKDGDQVEEKLPEDGVTTKDAQVPEPVEEAVEETPIDGDGPEVKAAEEPTENEATAGQTDGGELAEVPSQEPANDEASSDTLIVVETPEKDSNDEETPQASQPDGDGGEAAKTEEDNLIDEATEDVAAPDPEPKAPEGDNALLPEEADAEDTGEKEKGDVEQSPPAAGEEAGFEPPSEESKLDTLEVVEVTGEADNVASQDSAMPDETPKETVGEPANETELVLEAPPSPNLSKSSPHASQKHKNDHWERKHADNALKDVLEDSKVLERPHDHRKTGKEELRVRDRHRKSRRLSSTEDEETRRRRRAEKRLAEATRMVEEEKRRVEEEEKRRARRAARKAAEEEAARLRAEAATKRDAGRRQHREHRERDRDRESGRTSRQGKTAAPRATLSTIPKALKLTSGESVHGATVVKSRSGAYRPVKDAPNDPNPVLKDEVEATEPPRDAKSKSPPSSGGEKSHRRRRHHRERPEGERSGHSHQESGRRNRRPSDGRGGERPRSFLGGLIRI